MVVLDEALSNADICKDFFVVTLQEKSAIVREYPWFQEKNVR